MNIRLAYINFITTSKLQAYWKTSHKEVVLGENNIQDYKIKRHPTERWYGYTVAATSTNQLLLRLSVEYTVNLITRSATKYN